jgi:hypothetical protein
MGLLKWRGMKGLFKGLLNTPRNWVSECHSLSHSLTESLTTDSVTREWTRNNCSLQHLQVSNPRIWMFWLTLISLRHSCSQWRHSPLVPQSPTFSLNALTHGLDKTIITLYCCSRRFTLARNRKWVIEHVQAIRIFQTLGFPHDEGRAV